MSPERDDEMPAEFDMRGSARGKYLERYRRWASKNRVSITDATGTVEVHALTSVREGSAEIVQQEAVVYVTAYVLRRDVIAPAHVLQERRDVIAPAANAV